MKNRSFSLFTNNFSLLTFQYSLILVLLTFSCKKTEDTVAAVDTLPQLRKYIADNNIKVDSTPEKVFFILDKPGNGSFPKSTSTVKVYYKGYRLDGYVFDSTSFNPFESPLSQVIQGWTFGIPKIDKGGKGRLFIPAALAYGTSGAGSDIPANTPLIFDVEVVDFK